MKLNILIALAFFVVPSIVFASDVYDPNDPASNTVPTILDPQIQIRECQAQCDRVGSVVPLLDFDSCVSDCVARANGQVHDWFIPDPWSPPLGG